MASTPPGAPPPPPSGSGQPGHPPVAPSSGSPSFGSIAVDDTTRFRRAYESRAASDYIFSFWTQLGWTVLTCGIYGVYVMYQQVRRSRDHNRRRIELLESASNLCWARAQREGLGDELLPNFQRISSSLDEMRRIDREFRDPAIWALLALIGGGIAQIVAFILLDQDLIAHDRAEGAIEHELAQILSRFGIALIEPDPTRVKAPHNYGGRIAAWIGSCGIYAFWWTYDSMTEWNRHFEHNWRHDDAIAVAVNQLATA